MKTMKQWIAIAMATSLMACNNGDSEFDAQGTFEADEVLVSSEVSGRIIALNINEGDSLAAAQVVGKIDDVNLGLQKEQVMASIDALGKKTTDVGPQIKLLNEQLQVQSIQLKNLDREMARTEKLLKSDAATTKQLDDIRYQRETLQQQMNVTQQQIAVQRANNASQNRAILSESAPLQKKAAQLEDMVSRSSLVNPVAGTVITTYAEAGEMAVAGKPLYKIADLREMTLRAYVTGEQLSLIKTGQAVKLFVDKGAEAYNEYAGVITWISPKAEFTPKTIQTKEERANLVYAIKVKTKNNGLLKIGMYGEIKF